MRVYTRYKKAPTGILESVRTAVSRELDMDVVEEETEAELLQKVKENFEKVDQSDSEVLWRKYWKRVKGYTLSHSKETHTQPIWVRHFTIV
jgi:hypothetical protein